MAWLNHLRADPMPWLRQAKAAAMVTDPIKSILAAQDPAGWWVKPGPGYGPKYLGTVWQVTFLDQLGADGGHPQVARACDYMLDWCPSSSGGFAASRLGRGRPEFPGSMGQPVRLQRQDLDGRRTPGAGLQMGHPARL